jgi:hypothetical protein
VHDIVFERRQFMKKIAMAGVFLSMLAVGAYADTLTGFVSDDACGAKHAAGTTADQNCAKSCIKMGGSAVFVQGDKVFKIDNPASIKGHEGQKVTVDGKLNGDTIHIDAVKERAATAGGGFRLLPSAVDREAAGDPAQFPFFPPRGSLDGGTMPFKRRYTAMVPYISLS